MKHKLFSLAICLFLFFPSKKINAQAMPFAKIEKVIQAGQTVEFSVVAPEPFYVGNNIFVLYLGIKSFKLSRQTDIDGKGKLTFLIPATEYNSIADGGKIYLSYGEIMDMDQPDPLRTEAVSSLPNVCKYLGVFNKKMLVKKP